MKFDCVVMNPPYQAAKKNNKEGGRPGTLWDKFVCHSFEMIEDAGYICAVHPPGWRAPKGRYTNAKNLLLQNDMCYLKIHNAADGLKTFGAGTYYDWYICQKSEYKGKTTLIAEDGKKYVINIQEYPFIPNAMLNEIMNLIARDGEETCEVLFSRCAYDPYKKWMNKEKTNTYYIPVVSSVKKGGLNLIWSSKNNGMIGVPKVIFSRGQSRTYIDFDGEYGLGKDCRAIVDTRENLEGVNKALNNPEFIKISQACNLISTSMFVDKYNKDVLALFRKDFWKEFV